MTIADYEQLVLDNARMKFFKLSDKWANNERFRFKVCESKTAKTEVLGKFADEETADLFLETVRRNYITTSLAELRHGTPEMGRILLAANAVNENASGANLAELYAAIMDWPISQWPDELLRSPLSHGTGRDNGASGGRRRYCDCRIRQEDERDWREMDCNRDTAENPQCH